VFDVPNCGQDAAFAFSPNGSLLSPTGGDIYAVDGVDELAGGRGAAMGNGIGFDESGDGFIPLVGFNGDMCFEQGAGFGGGASLAKEFASSRRQDAVDGGSGDSGELRQNGLGDDEKVEIGQPQRQERFETFGARMIGGYPDFP